MIISCPECAGPFEVQDDRIAALVQVACPHCAFRMILDFAAANDPGLVEQGMRMASGFRSAADYHASVQLSVQPAGPVEAEPEAIEVEATTGEPAPPALEIVAPVEPTLSVEPVRAEPVRAEPVRAEGVPPVRVRPEPVSPAPSPPRPVAPMPGERRPVSEEARTEVHMLPRGERMVPVDIPPVRRPPAPRPDEEDIAVNVPSPATEIVRTTTVVGPPPVPPIPPPAAEEVAIDFDDEDDATTTDEPPVRPAATAAEDAAHPAFGSEADEDVPTMVVSPEHREAARRDLEAMTARRTQVAPEPEPELDPTPSSRERPRPPHTPPGRAKVTSRDEEPTTPAATERPGRRPAAEARKPAVPPPVTTVQEVHEEEVEQERMSTFGVVVVVLVLLIAGGLVGGSVALNADHSPDPRPLLEKLYRQYVKGEPAAPKTEPAAPKT